MSGHAKPIEVNEVPVPIEKLETDPKGAPGYLASAVLEFNEQLERMAELALVLAAGALIATTPFNPVALAVGAVLILVIRPLSTYPITSYFGASRHESLLVAWFGIRGVGSLYYLFYAVHHGVDDALAEQLVGLVLPIVALSICIHGATAGPLMARYERSRHARGPAPKQGEMG
jgi:NhaP-type Na+/H+ or K+/H+ antiporter